MSYVFKAVSRSPESSCDIGEGIERKFSERWDVVLDLEDSTSLLISPFQVWQNCPELPRFGQYWSSPDGNMNDFLSLMRSFTGRRSHNEKAQFSFVFSYATKGRNDSPEQQQGTEPNQPDALFPDWSLTTEDRMITQLKDLDFKKYANSARDLFDPGIMINDPIIVFNYNRIETRGIFQAPTFRDLFNHSRDYKDKVNDVDFLIPGDKEKWLCTSIDMKPELIGNRRYVRRSLVLKYSSTGWQEKILDAGYFQKGPNAPGVYDPEYGWTTSAERKYKVPILNPTTKQPVTKPWPLNNGFAVEDPHEENAFKFLDFRTKNKANFDALNIEII